MSFVDDLGLYTLGYMAHESHPMRLDAYCLNTVQRKNPCDACTQTCPKGVSVHAEKVNWSGCTNCNLCITACPTEALHESDTSFKGIMSLFDSPDDYVIIGCGRYRDRVDARVSCLAALPWETIAALALSKRVVLKVSPCKECPERDLHDRVGQLFSQLKFFFGKEEFRRRVFPKAPEGAASSEGYGKRRAFTDLASVAKEGAAKLLSDREPDVSHYRAVLLDVLASIPPDKRPEVRWRTLVEDGHCHACEICSKMCPHHAISIVVPGYNSEGDDVPAGGADAAMLAMPAESAGEGQGAQPGEYMPVHIVGSQDQATGQWYVHDASRCTQCGLCYMACPFENIGGWDTLATSDVPALVAHPIDVRLCEKCGRPFKPEGDEVKCKICSRYRFGRSTI